MKSALQKLHKAFDNSARLGIMAALAANRSLDFNELKELLNLTDGNLASHIKVLEKEAFIDIAKTFIGKKPNTRYSISREGRKSFEAHINALEQLISEHKKQSRPVRRRYSKL